MKLKPCPFCGKEVYIEKLSESEWKICCIDLNCLIRVSTYAFETQDKAISCWNQRATKGKKNVRRG